jgi:hypothetical protein
LSADGKPAKVALVACMRKMLVMLNGRVRDHLATACGQFLWPALEEKDYERHFLTRRGMAPYPAQYRQ